MGIELDTNFDNIEYIEIGDYFNVPIVKISELETYLALINKFKPSLVYINKHEYAIRKEDGTIYRIEDRSGYTTTYFLRKVFTEFLFFHEKIMYLLIGWGFNTIPDMINGRSKGFKYGEAYYNAINSGFSDFKEYEESTNLGYKTKSDYEESKKIGFRGCYKALEAFNYVEYEIRYDLWNEIEEEFIGSYEFKILKSGFKSESDIYYYAIELGYNDFKEFKNGITKGFKNAKEYRNAISKGFNHAIQYKIALNSGFQNSDEFEEARTLAIESKEEYDIYRKCKHIKEEYGCETTEESHLFSILLNLKTGKKLSLSKLLENLQTEQNKFFRKEPRYGDFRRSRNNDYQYFPPDWYSKKFNEEYTLEEFLTKKEIVSSIGDYDVEGGIFERKAPPAKKKGKNERFKSLEI
ncbi:hypothetical protein [Candidatus Borrarchaeum sp.]|uniref:hypothetical protein n=1 Tax=Candidatus Borrarchaeum sp. TaxID=2846742 RepID=UPI00257EBDCE|nr:hypothetical protein [Candidatus Borrarchaeum sp.]